MQPISSNASISSSHAIIVPGQSATSPVRASNPGLPGLVHIGNDDNLGHLPHYPSASAGKSSCFGWIGRRLGIESPIKHSKANFVDVGFHGTGLKEAINLVRTGLKELDTVQHTNLAAGGFCFAKDRNIALSYASDRLDSRLGSLAVTLAVEPTSGRIDIQAECESGGLEPIQAAGHDAEFIVSPTRYEEFNVKWDSLLCRVPSGVAEYRVKGAKLSDLRISDTKSVPTLELSVAEQVSKDQNRASSTSVNIDLRTGRALRWR